MWYVWKVHLFLVVAYSSCMFVYRRFLSQLNMNLEKYRNYLFLILLVLVYTVIDYQTILFLSPRGIHFIRQTDSLSFVANYLKNGFHFFEPQVFNLQSIEGKAACEFPILYYLTAILYSIFGEHEFFLRLLTIIIASTGFFYLFKLLFNLLHDLVYALSFSFLFISSTALLYYTNNFLPDASALGFTLTGWYFFFKFMNNRTLKYSLFISFAFFTLASLLKVTYFINPMAAIISLLIHHLSVISNFKKVIRTNAIPTMAFIASFIIVLGWNIYVIQYNRITHDNYFLVQWMPIWSLNQNQIADVWEHFTNNWYSRYYYQSTFHMFLIIFVSGIVFLKRSERAILIIAIVSLAGTISYFLLFFAQFKYHDYYFIAMIPAIIFLVINAFMALRHKYTRLINNYITKLLVVTICVLSLNYAREKINQRYLNSNDIFSSIGFKLTDTRDYLDSLEVSKQAKFIILTDQTPNGGLYFINRQGWNVKDTSQTSLNAISSYINQGADYLLLTDNQFINKRFKGSLIGEKDGIRIYDLKNYQLD